MGDGEGGRGRLEIIFSDLMGASHLKNGIPVPNRGVTSSGLVLALERPLHEEEERDILAGRVCGGGRGSTLGVEELWADRGHHNILLFRHSSCVSEPPHKKTKTNLGRLAR